MWQERAAHADLYTADPLVPFNPLEYGSDSHINTDIQPHTAASKNTQTSQRRIKNRVQSQTPESEYEHRETEKLTENSADIQTQVNTQNLAQNIAEIDKLTNTHTPNTKPLHQLGFFTMDVRGLYKSKYDLQQAIHSHRPDILVLTETKLKSSESRL